MLKDTGYLEITDGIFGNYTKMNRKGDVKIIREEGKMDCPRFSGYSYSWLHES